MSGTTVLMAKHAELNLGIIYSMCFFQFKLLSVCKPRNLFASASSINLLSKPIFKLGHVLFLVANFILHYTVQKSPSLQFCIERFLYLASARLQQEKLSDTN
jgi:hypothetical protein